VEIGRRREIGNMSRYTDSDRVDEEPTQRMLERQMERSLDDAELLAPRDQAVASFVSSSGT